MCRRFADRENEIATERQRDRTSPSIPYQTMNASTKSIKASEALEDIRAGMSDSQLMAKYKLTAKGLQSLTRKLQEAGFLTQSELGSGMSSAGNPEAGTWKCPACGSALSGETATCPRCGAMNPRTPASQWSHEPSATGGSGPGTPEVGLNPAVESLHKAKPAYVAAASSSALTLGAVDAAVDEFDEEIIPEPRHMDSTDALVLVGGLVGALICLALQWPRWILSVFITLVHEMGHTIVGWLFGYPSLPAFDVIWGGGVTVHLQRSWLLAVGIYVLFGWLMYLYRRNRATMVFLGIVALIHAWASLTQIHSVIILFMGHGTELIIAGLFIYRAASGRSIILFAERPLYALIGFFIVLHDLPFAYRLITSVGYRAQYAACKGGDMNMDFVRIASDHLNVSLPSVATFFLVCCVMTPILALLAFRYEEYVHSAIARRWVREAPSR